jgi:uncharacterized Fe-S cluster protein YjdI
MRKEYTLGDLTIIWQPHLCVHSGICVRSLPAVFKPRERPWIQLHEEDLEEARKTVLQCPSGAISIPEPGEKNQA